LRIIENRCQLNDVIVGYEPETQARAREVLGETPYSARWQHRTARLAGSIAPLLLLTAAYLGVTGWALRRRDPPRMTRAAH
jgi:hypothetical protein